MRPGQWICLSRVFAWRGELADALPGEVGRGSLEVRPHRLDRGHWWPVSAVVDVRAGGVPASEDERGGHPGKRRRWPGAGFPRVRTAPSCAAWQPPGRSGEVRNGASCGRRPSHDPAEL